MVRNKKTIIVKQVRPAQQKKKNKGAKRRRNKGSKMSAGMLTRELLKSRMNPFTYSACIPDGAKGVGCFSIKNVEILSTGAAGAGGGCVAYGGTVDPQNFFVQVTNSATSAPTFSTNWNVAGFTTSTIPLSSLYAKWRPVSAGLRATFIGSTLNDQGLLLGGLVSGGTPISTFNAGTMGINQVYFKDYIVSPLRNGIEILWAPDDVEDTTQFQNFGAQQATATYQSQSPYMLIIAYGTAVSAAVVQIEHVVNYEAQFSNQSFLPGGLTAAQPAEPGWYETVQNFLVDYPNVLPAIGQTVWNAANSKMGQNLLGSMANGYLGNGLLAKTGLPRIRY